MRADTHEGVPEMTSPVTSEEMLQRSEHAARNLYAAGFRPTDRLCIAAPNSPELVVVVLAALRTGIIPAMVSAQSTEREILEMSQDIEATRVLRHSDVVSLVIDDKKDEESVSEVIPELTDFPRCRPMHFTSGTTGRPKAVWSGWLTETDARAWVDEEVQVWGLMSSDVHLVNGPLSHSAPLRFALMTVFSGGSLIIPEKFDAENALTLLMNAGVTTTFCAPTHLQRLMEIANPDQQSDSLRLVAYAGAHCPDHVAQWSHRFFGLSHVVEFYGSTEGQFTVCPAPLGIEHPGSVGRARPGRQLVTDADGQIWCHVPDYARFTYWGDERKTQAAWRPDNWFTVGDFGFIDAEGFVFLHGRRGDLIITGGVNVYPAEIERVLASLPGVVESVAFGIPDPEWGQRVCVAVECPVGSLSETEVRSFLAEQLSGPKRPKDVYLLRSFPRTPLGKVDRRRVPQLCARPLA